MKLHFIASETEKSAKSYKQLTGLYGQASRDSADVIIVLGGDGFMLDCLRQFIRSDIPFFGLRLGTVGFLMNDYRQDDLLMRIDAAQTTFLYPLRMMATDIYGNKTDSLAINEVSLLRQTKQSAHIQVSVNQQIKIEKLVGDGVLLATPAGSTAYNLSAHGPILPIGSHMLALTPISPFRPRRWRGAVIPDTATVEFKVLDYQKRPISATADNEECREVSCVKIRADKEVKIPVLFDPMHNLEDRILNEQFE